MKKLLGFQKKYLRGLAHNLNPVIQIGKNGLTEKIIKEIDQQLNNHELIKIRFLDFKDEKKEITSIIEKSTKSFLAGTIGHIAILYRMHTEKEKRKISLPD